MVQIRWKKTHTHVHTFTHSTWRVHTKTTKTLVLFFSLLFFSFLFLFISPNFYNKQIKAKKQQQQQHLEKKNAELKHVHSSWEMSTEATEPPMKKAFCEHNADFRQFDKKAGATENERNCNPRILSHKVMFVWCERLKFVNLICFTLHILCDMSIHATQCAGSLWVKKCSLLAYGRERER